MKKIILILGILLMSTFVLAEKIAPQVIECPPGFTCQVLYAGEAKGIMPDNPLYGLDVMMDNLKLKLASKEAKARIRLKIAEERIDEMGKMAQLEKTKALGKAEKEYNKHIDELEEMSIDISSNVNKYITKLDVVKKRLTALNKTKALPAIETVIKGGKIIIEKGVVLKKDLIVTEGTVIVNQGSGEVNQGFFKWLGNLFRRRKETQLTPAPTTTTPEPTITPTATTEPITPTTTTLTTAKGIIISKATGYECPGGICKAPTR